MVGAVDREAEDVADEPGGPVPVSTATRQVPSRKMSDAVASYILLAALWGVLGWPRRGVGDTNELSHVVRSDESWSFTIRPPSPVLSHAAMGLAAVGLLVATLAGASFWGVLSLMFANIMIVVRAIVRLSRRRDPQYPRSRVEIRLHDGRLVVIRDGDRLDSASSPRVDVVHSRGSVDIGQGAGRLEVTAEMWGVSLATDQAVVRLAEFVGEAEAKSFAEDLFAWLDHHENHDAGGRRGGGYRRPSPPRRDPFAGPRAHQPRSLGGLATLAVVVVVLVVVGLDICLLLSLAERWSAWFAVVGYLGPAVGLDVLVRRLGS